MKFAIIVGHENSAQGAVSKILGTEYDFNLSLSIEMYRIARSLGMDCQIFKRDGLGRGKVGELVSKYADCAIELHFDSVDDPKVRGSTTLYDESGSLEFAKLVHAEMISCLGRGPKQDRGLDLVSSKDRGFYNLSVVKIPSCLVEPAFGSSPEDSKLLLSNKSEYARALVKAAHTYLSGKQKEH